MTRILFATQQVDSRHPTLGAAADLVRALAGRVDEVVVLASSASLDDLPDNVRFRSFAARSQALRGVRFEVALARELSRGRPTAFLAHMSPVYALLAAPMLRTLKVPVLLWFTQQRGGANLARAERVVDAILSVDARSVPLSSPKVRAIGHGVDVGLFVCTSRVTDPSRLRLLSLGRYSDVKGHDVAIRALTSLPGAELTVHGEEATPADVHVRARLAALARELGLEDRVSLLDAIPRSKVPDLFAGTDVLVNATKGTSADKVVFEAVAACLPVVWSSPVFDRLLPSQLRFPGGDEAGLAAAVTAAVGLGLEARRQLRARVASEHSVEHWAHEVLAAATLPREG
jgi:glycosyltransferase involved in cell wall biosynthesis